MTFGRTLNKALVADRITTTFADKGGSMLLRTGKLGEQQPNQNDI